MNTTIILNKSQNIANKSKKNTKHKSQKPKAKKKQVLQTPNHPKNLEPTTPNRNHILPINQSTPYLKPINPPRGLTIPPNRLTIKKSRPPRGINRLLPSPGPSPRHSSIRRTTAARRRIAAWPPMRAADKCLVVTLAVTVAGAVVVAGRVG